MCGNPAYQQQQHILAQVILNEAQKYLKLLELLGQYQEQGSVLVFVDKQERADSLLKDLLGSSYCCMALHGGKQDGGLLCVTMTTGSRV